MAVGRVLAVEEENPSHEMRLRFLYPSLKRTNWKAEYRIIP
jgi:hypothetical protein